MPLDIPASPIASQTIRYARAAWDVSRDGGEVGIVSLPSQQVPSGALMLGYAWVVVDQFTDLGTSAVEIMAGGRSLNGDIDPVASSGAQSLGSGVVIPTAGGSLPIILGLTGDGYSAGSMLIYVFYV